MARGSAQLTAGDNILYGDARPRGQTGPYIFLPDDLLTGTDWFESCEGFSGTNRWVARADDMTRLDIPLGLAQEHKLDQMKTLSGPELGCFRLPTRLVHTPDKLLQGAVPCREMPAAGATGSQLVKLENAPHLRAPRSPYIPGDGLAAVRKLVGSTGEWYHNSDEGLFLLVRDNTIFGAVRECASQEQLECEQKTIADSYQLGSKVIINNRAERYNGKPGVITRVDDEMTGLLSVHMVRVKTSRFTHHDAAIPVTQLIPTACGFKAGQRVMSPDGPAFFLGIDIGDDTNDHQMSYRVALENQLTETGIQYALAGDDRYLEASSYRQGELFTS